MSTAALLDDQVEITVQTKDYNGHTPTYVGPVVYENPDFIVIAVNGSEVVHAKSRITIRRGAI